MQRLYIVYMPMERDDATFLALLKEIVTLLDMPAALLNTKFYFPTTRPSLVWRPRLVERLQVGLRGPLTLISAPAGSGKTTLVSDCRDGPGA